MPDSIGLILLCGAEECALLGMANPKNGRWLGGRNQL
jgi:hypothetical protein